MIASKDLAIWQASRYHRPMRLADLVRTEREKQRLSQAELARRAGVSPPVISRLEDGKRLGRGDTIARVTRALGIDPAIVQSILREEQEERDVQYIDLSEVPPEDRPALKRSIDALVREYKRTNES
jgi:transcriptional regulator with XRE-family HTH domain